MAESKKQEIIDFLESVGVKEFDGNVIQDTVAYMDRSPFVILFAWHDPSAASNEANQCFVHIHAEDRSDKSPENLAREGLQQFASNYDGKAVLPWVQSELA